MTPGSNGESMNAEALTPDMAYVIRLVQCHGTVAKAMRAPAFKNSRKWRAGLSDCMRAGLFFPANQMTTCTADKLLADHERVKHSRSTPQKRLHQARSILDL